MLLLAVGLCLGIFIFARGEVLALSWMSHSLKQQSLVDLSKDIGPAVSVTVPEGRGDGPFPVLILLHGCGGVRPDDHANWAALAADMGYVTAVVDSNMPRGYTWQIAQNTVCKGNALLGQERASDILVGLTKALETGMADSDAVLLIGWSHGAWAAMDFMTMSPDLLPAGISSYDGPWPTVRGIVLYYPYCGLGALTRVRSWEAEPSVLALMGAKDQRVDTAACTKLLKQKRTDRESVDIVIYPEANHSFDYVGRGPKNSRFRPDDAADAKARVISFLEMQRSRWSRK